LDTSLTPKAAASDGGDVCSTTLVEETEDAVVATGDGVDGLKPASPPRDESRDDCADNAGEQTVDAAADEFFPASAGKLSSLLLHRIIRLTLLSKPNKVDLKCSYVHPSVRPSRKSFFDFSDIWHVGRRRCTTVCSMTRS